MRRSVVQLWWQKYRHLRGHQWRHRSRLDRGHRVDSLGDRMQTSRRTQLLAEVSEVRSGVTDQGGFSSIEKNR